MTADCPTTPEDIAQYQKKGFISYPNFSLPKSFGNWQTRSITP